jgi:hypothetical protein
MFNPATLIQAAEEGRGGGGGNKHQEETVDGKIKKVPSVSKENACLYYYTSQISATVASRPTALDFISRLLRSSVPASRQHRKYAAISR